MKIGTIVQPNEKGQVVIPKAIRDALGITPKVPLNVMMSGQTICLSPLRVLISGGENDQESYLSVLEKTRGSWKDEDWETLRKKRRAIELKASRRNRKAW